MPKQGERVLVEATVVSVLEDSTLLVSVEGITAGHRQLCYVTQATPMENPDEPRE